MLFSQEEPGRCRLHVLKDNGDRFEMHLSYARHPFLGAAVSIESRHQLFSLALFDAAMAPVGVSIPPILPLPTAPLPAQSVDLIAPLVNIKNRFLPRPIARDVDPVPRRPELQKHE
jgi:hypothetical protein